MCALIFPSIAEKGIYFNSIYQIIIILNNIFFFVYIPLSQGNTVTEDVIPPL